MGKVSTKIMTDQTEYKLIKKSNGYAVEIVNTVYDVWIEGFFDRTIDYRKSKTGRWLGLYNGWSWIPEIFNSRADAEKKVRIEFPNATEADKVV